MEVIFKNEYLQELYKTGKSSKYKKLPAQVVRKFPLAVRILQQIKIIQDIWKLIGLMMKKQLELLVLKILVITISD